MCFPVDGSTIVAVISTVGLVLQSVLHARNIRLEKKFDIAIKTKINAYAAYGNALSIFLKTNDYATFFAAHSTAYILSTPPTRSALHELMQMAAQKSSTNDVPEQDFFKKYDALLEMFGDEVHIK